MFKRVFLSGLVIFIVIALAAVYLYRHRIIQYSVEKFILSSLPDFVKIDRITLDQTRGVISFEDFRIYNPSGFSSKYLIEISNITCGYKARGGNLLEGVEILEPTLDKMALNIERLKDGRLNITEMGKVTGARGEDKIASLPGASAKKNSQMIAGRKISDLIKIPEVFNIRSSSIVFTDRMPYQNPYVIRFEDISARVGMRLNDSYSSVLWVDSDGSGKLNGKADESLGWVVAWNPATPKLTMSNRFEAEGLDILTFAPYYDKYSPIVFKSGRFSGTLVFDFDNGNIGSTNEVRLRDLSFYVKQGAENAGFWDATVPDLVKYLKSSFGDIVFDFKIKGDMSNPKFYLGPISKQAMVSMAIDKTAQVISAISKDGSQAGAGSSGSDLDKAMQYIDAFKELMKKK